MFTVTKCLLNLSKEGSYSDEIFEMTSDNISEVIIKTTTGEETSFECIDNLIVKLSEESIDNDYIDQSVSNVMQYFEKQSEFNAETCHLVKLKGVLYRVFKRDDIVFIHNEITDEVQYECKMDELKLLLESEDKYYETYRKEHQEA